VGGPIMVDTFYTSNPEAICDDCGIDGIVVVHWGPMVPVGERLQLCRECWKERNDYYGETGKPKPVRGDS